MIEPIDWSGAIDVQVPVHKEILIDSLAWPRVKEVQVPVYKDVFIDSLDWSGANDIQVPVYKDVLIDSVDWLRAKNARALSTGKILWGSDYEINRIGEAAAPSLEMK